MGRDNQGPGPHPSNGTVYGPTEKGSLDSRIGVHEIKDQEEVPEGEDAGGLKLWAVLASMALLMFIMMLDISIVSTVSSVMLKGK